MSGHIEARSLSSLNNLADNPPQYPINPVETPRESLMLYISRVPGTKDIILSPLKPQIKTITVEDISNSLYYVHFQLPSEEPVAAPRPARDGSPRKAIPRKPLPSGGNAPMLESRQLDPAPINPPRTLAVPLAGPPAHPLQVLTDGAGHGDNVYGNPRPEKQGVTATYSPINRRPLGPRIMGMPPVPANEDRTRRTTPPSASSGPYQRPTSFDQPRPSITSFADVGSGPSYAYRTPSQDKPRQRPSFTPSTLTLIRRDPVSNHQQNVAIITTYQTNIPTPDMADPDLAPDNMPQPPPPAINIRVENPGYIRFRDWPTRAAIDKYAAEGHLNLRPGETIIDGPDRRARGTSFSVPQAQEPGFNRQVVMTYGKSWTSNIKSALHMRNRSQGQTRGEMDDDDCELAPPRAPGLTHRRQDSASSTGSLESTGSRTRAMSSGGPGSPTSPPSPVITRPGPGVKPKGYMFTSPWDGRCEFRTGRGGRTLICRHVLGTSGNSLTTAALGHAPDGSRVVSELRFNLPGSSTNDGVHGHHARHSFQGKFDRLLKLDPRLRRAGDSSDEYDDYDEVEDGGMDLQLGLERAGGGKRGNRAKLGKLIIHDEGLKMLDLVVAANVGMLWASWEKVQSD